MKHRPEGGILRPALARSQVHDAGWRIRMKRNDAWNHQNRGCEQLDPRPRPPNKVVLRGKQEVTPHALAQRPRKTADFDWRGAPGRRPAMEVAGQGGKRATQDSWVLGRRPPNLPISVVFSFFSTLIVTLRT